MSEHLSLPRPVRSARGSALYGFVNGGITVATLGAIAHFAHSPLVFPSLGPTAFLLFHDPLSPAASPRNALLGHLIGALAGWACLLVFSLANIPAGAPGEIGWARVGAAALSLALTSGLMSWWDLAHPPAGATTMIISLGLLPTFADVVLVMCGVFGMVVQGAALNRLAGLPYPFWSPRRCPEAPAV